MTLNEAKTRALQIDPQLRAADWKLNDRTQRWVIAACPRGLYTVDAESKSAADGCDIRTLSMNSVQSLGSVSLF